VRERLSQGGIRLGFGGGVLGSKVSSRKLRVICGGTPVANFRGSWFWSWC
jgi:hypothetical protein